MTIIEKTYNWTIKLSNRRSTNRIILHHAACDATPEQIDAAHKRKGWSGIGYHFYIRKDGSVYRGRPENAIGAHAKDNNKDSIGICFEGNYDTERSMPYAQLDAGEDLISYIKSKYKISKVQKHKDVCSTACPGRFFPFTKLAGVVAATKIRADVSGYPTIRKGNKGNYVVTVQRILKIEDDGSFGPQTDKAVRKFQKAAKITVDGVVGPITWDKLING